MGCGCNKSKKKSGTRRVTRRRPGTRNVKRLPLIRKTGATKTKKAKK